MFDGIVSLFDEIVIIIGVAGITLFGGHLVNKRTILGACYYAFIVGTVAVGGGGWFACGLYLCNDDLVGGN